MKSISIDLETFSSIDITKCGAYKYAEAPDFEILLFGYAVDGGDVQVIDLANGEVIPQDILDALTDDRIIKWAFNANFERVCLSRYLADRDISLDTFHDSHPLSTECSRFLNPAGWRCTMVWGAYLGLPLSLAAVGKVLGLSEQKMSEGKSLIRYFCSPCAPTKVNDGRTRNLPCHAQEKWSVFKDYNRRDVEVEMAIQARLAKFPVPDFVWDEYHLDQEINDRGIRIDMTLVENAISIDTSSHETFMAKLKQLTHLDNPNSVQQMKSWLSQHGLETDSLDKKAVNELLKTASLEIAEVLSLRQRIAKSSVKKYIAMTNTACADHRARGTFRFYGANRTGRFSGKNIQLQNLPQNHLEHLEDARNLVRAGDFTALEILYDSVPDVLSQLIRTALIPRDGQKFIVADFSAIEARVLSWLAGEKWRMDVFANNGDIYCATASRMFHCNVVKHGENGHLRQKGKQAELACIAEGQLVLTDKGLVPIEKITKAHRLWDGDSWVEHDGVIFKGKREVITYEGLTATSDHLVWIEGESRPVQFGIAASCGAHIVQTGNGGTAIRLGKNYQSRETLECSHESLLCTDQVYRMRSNTMAVSGQPSLRKIQRMSNLLPAEADSPLVGQAAYRGKTALRKSEKQGISQLRSKGNQVRFPQRVGCGAVYHRNDGATASFNGIGSYRHERELCQRQSEICAESNQSGKSQEYDSLGVSSRVLALQPECGAKEAVARNDTLRDNSRCGKSCRREKKELAHNQRTARLYDIRNAGEHHRFTVSGKLVHNCGYGGSVGALKAFGALESGMREDELKPLVDAWREANPNIVDFWWSVDDAAKSCIKEHTTTATHGIRFIYQSGMMFIELPSGRRLAYAKPHIGENQFGGESITYMGLDVSKKWSRVESYGPKLVENITQGISRDILCYAMKTLWCMDIVAHVHDELIIECDQRVSLDAVCKQMARTPPWAKGLLLRADGFECQFYRKD